MNHATPAQRTLQQTLDAFLEEFETAVTDGARAPATLAMHREHCRWICERIPPTTPIAEIDSVVVDSAAVLEGRGRRRGPNGETRRVSRATVAKRLCTLKLAFKVARRRRWVERVPEFPSLERVYRPRVMYLRDPRELARLCAELPTRRADWVRLATFTGMRPGDLERLRAYDDCDPFSSPPWYLRRSTKNRQPPVRLIMPKTLAHHLRGVFARERLRPGAPVVTPWPKDSRACTLRRLGARLGLLLRRATDLRHTFATWGAHELRGVTPGLARALGHVDSSTTARIYVHVLPPAEADVARALDRAARGPRAAPKRVPPGRHTAARKKETATGEPTPAAVSNRREESAKASRGGLRP